MDQAKQSSRNRMLELFDPHDLEQLGLHFEHITLEYRQVLYEADKRIEWVYFLNDGVASLVNTMENGSAAEIGTIGNEGVVGLPILLGDAYAPTSAYIQVPGSGLRIKAATLRDRLRQSSTLQSVMLRYAHAFFNQVAQSAACVHFHSIEQRCCRWLLMTHDRVQSDEFLLTQEFLAMMLGCRRTSVTAAARYLKKRNIIEYNRGQVKILDRTALEKCSCECYAVSKHEYDRLLGKPLGSIERSTEPPSRNRSPLHP
jgi:CRP-like cAMP-binding protein